MRTPKALQLLKLLNTKEVDQLKGRFKKYRKDRMLAAVEWMLKSEDFPSVEAFKAAIFPVIFKETYSEQKDFLLRNELRLLAESIEGLLVELQIKKEIGRHKLVFSIFLLSALLERKAYDLFKATSKSVMEQALSNADHFATWAVAGLQFHLLTRHLHEKETNLELASQINDSLIIQLNSFYVAAYRNFQVNKYYLRQQMHPFLGDVHSTGIDAPEVPSGQEEIAGYFLKKAKSYLQPIPQRIEALTECLQYARNRANSMAVFKKEVKFCLAELAMLNSLHSDFEASEAYFQQFFELDVEPGDLTRLAVLTDYIAKLLREHKPQEAIRWMQEHYSDIEAVEKLQIRLLCLRVAAFAQLGDPEKLYEALPENFGDYNRTVRHFFRLHYAIHAWQINEIEMAVRELDNLLNVLQKGEPLVFDVRPVARLMKRYFTWSAIPKGQARQRNLEKLREDLMEYEQEAPPVYKSYLPLLWLKKELV
ncbi:MAG: hypothetical protein H6577_15820 [Lewinellaceae bacterium]|nr:hypothetical protein [Saprospiraceae bacterium]MCB9339596.1 hypothetical protein [Lewinellaceae bacterium]